jgi:hypothetical protein
LPLLEKIIDSGLPFIYRLNQSQQFEPVKISGEARVVGSPEGLFTNLNAFLVQALYFLAQGMVDIGTAPFSMLDKILLGKESGSVQ